MSDTDNFTVSGGPTITVKKVDSVVVNLTARVKPAGSVGDIAATSIGKISNAPGPRGPACQAQLNSKIPAGKAPASYPGNLADSDAGN